MKGIWMQVAFGAFDEGNEVIQQLVQQAGNIAWLHCALSLVEWVLMLSTPCAWPAKLQVGTIAVVTNALVLAVRHKALRTDWLQAQR